LLCGAVSSFHFSILAERHLGGASALISYGNKLKISMKISARSWDKNVQRSKTGISIIYLFIFLFTLTVIKYRNRSDFQFFALKK